MEKVDQFYNRSWVFKFRFHCLTPPHVYKYFKTQNTASKETFSVQKCQREKFSPKQKCFSLVKSMFCFGLTGYDSKPLILCFDSIRLLTKTN